MYGIEQLKVRCVFAERKMEVKLLVILHCSAITNVALLTSTSLNLQ
jgi:hypothetical protein